MAKYTPAQKNAIEKYSKNNLKRISVNYTLNEYESRIEPAVLMSGLPLATFIKMAVEEKIARDYPKI